MAEQLAGLKRTCRCAELTKADVGKTVTVMGWVHARRDLGSLIFTWIRDVSGVIQAVFSEEQQVTLWKSIFINGKERNGIFVSLRVLANCVKVMSFISITALWRNFHIYFTAVSKVGKCE